ncbi:MAG: FG-GAP repeat domain-containing protein, partial [Sphingomicrobium sp.]
MRGYAGWTSIQQQGNDVVVTFAPGDALILRNQSITNISVAQFQFNAAALPATNAAAAPVPLPVSLALSRLVGHDGDFNGDGRADVLWRNEGGTISDWLGTASGGFSINDGTALTQVSTDWHIIGRGDFNGDGKDDMLWRNDNGTLSDWLGNSSGGFTINDGVALQNVPNSWHVVGTGDFNNDGKDDILWRN